MTSPKADPISADGPPAFEVQTQAWWVKVLGMLMHNWALIETLPDGSARVYFVHDGGSTKNFVPGYRWHQLKGRVAIVDSLDFESPAQVALSLRKNGFRSLHDHPGPWNAAVPVGSFFDARATEDGVYSRVGQWR